MCKEWAKTDCQKEHGKQKRVAEEDEEDQSCNGKNEILNGQVRTVNHRRRQREMERVNNESGRSYQVTWTPPRKEARVRRSNGEVTLFLLTVLKGMYLVLFSLIDNLFCFSHSLIVLNFVFISNSTFPFCSYVETESSVPGRVISSAYIMKLNF